MKNKDNSRILIKIIKYMSIPNTLIRLTKHLLDPRKQDPAQNLDLSVTDVTSSNQPTKQKSFFSVFLLQAIETYAEPYSMYPLLNSNLPMIDHGLASLLDNWFTEEVGKKIPHGQKNYLARLMFCIGNLFLEYPNGSKEYNLMLAISGFTNALVVFKETEDKVLWAHAHNNLGLAYQGIAPFKENPVNSSNKAISHYINALRVRTEANLPHEWGVIQNNLSSVFCSLAPFAESPRSLVQESISACNKALSVFTEAKLPTEWAFTTRNLGNAYYELSSFSENPQEELEKCISAYTESLRVYTEDTHPREYALTNTHLGGAYSAIASLSKSPDKYLQDALTAYDNALRIFKETELPYEYALTYNNLGTTYMTLASFSEKPHQLIESAILAFRNALRNRAQAKRPHDIALTSTNLGKAYSALAPLTENPCEHLQSAINAFTNALSVSSQQRTNSWAEINKSLGVAYLELSHFGNDPAGHIQNAIRYNSNCFNVYTRYEFAQEWAEINNNLGISFGRLSRFSENPRGELEKGIHFFNSALEVCTETEYAQNWARTNYNLGLLYLELATLSENPKCEIFNAINVLQNALRSHTQDIFPQERAKIINMLGSAYGYFETFTKKPVEQIHKAIEAHTNALFACKEDEMPMLWAEANNNLGVDYNLLAQYSDNPSEEINKAIKAFNKALRSGQPSRMPELYSTIYNNLGNSLRWYLPYSTNPNETIQNAATCYRKALELRDPVLRSADCLQTAINLGELGFTNAQHDLAIEGYTIAIHAVENLRAIAIEPVTKGKILEKAMKAYENLVQVYINLKEYDKALELADRSKAQNLVEILSNKKRYPCVEISEEVIRRLDFLRGAIAHSQFQLSQARQMDWKNMYIIRSEKHIDITHYQPSTNTAKNYLLQLMKELQDLIEEKIKPIDPFFSPFHRIDPISFEEIKLSLHDKNSVTISWYCAGNKLFAFLVASNISQPLFHVYPENTLQKLTDLVESSYSENFAHTESWGASIAELLATISSLLDIRTLVSKINDICPNADQLVLIPHRFLHSLPLHVLPLNDSSVCLLDLFNRGVRFAPSLQILSLAQKHGAKTVDTLLAVANPTEDLPYSDMEVAIIQTLFGPKATVLARKQASRSEFDRLGSLLGNTNCLHFSCHGMYNCSRPLQSALLLADCQIHPPPAEYDLAQTVYSSSGELIDLKKCLTLMDLFQLNLSKVRLVVISACETGLFETNSLEYECAGLSTGFLFAGANTVVCSLWTVPDISTGILMVQFYQVLKAKNQTGLPVNVALALKHAQNWLRTLTLAGLEAQRSSLPDFMHDNFDHDIQRLKRKYSANDCPFNSPYYWAAFTAVGQ